jgi:arylsulfatase A-like enzyme
MFFKMFHFQYYLWLAGCIVVAHDKSNPLPNVVILFVDDLGWGDIGANGNTTIRTPHVDHLANNGAKFTHWMSASSICTPSRASLLTGRYPQRQGLTSSDWRFRVLNSPSLPGGLPFNELTMAEYLRDEHHYRTHMSGKWHLGIGANFEYLPHHHGFDHWYGMGCTNVLACDPKLNLYPTTTLLEFVVRKTPEMWFGITIAVLTGYILGPLRRQRVTCCGAHIGRRLDIALILALALLVFVWWYTGELTLINPLGCVLFRDGVIVQQPLTLHNLTQRVTGDAQHFIRDAAASGAPFFLYLPFVHVHTALFAMPEFVGKSKHGFYGDNVEEMDWAVGEILKTLKEVGAYENTLTFFSSDNGPFLERGNEGGFAGPFRGAKGQNWEGGIRVPGIMHWPQKILPGQVLDMAVNTMDIFPTTMSIVESIAAGKTSSISSNSFQRPNFDGKDLRSHIAGLSKSGTELRKDSPYEFMFHYCGNDLAAVRYKGKYKLHYFTSITEKNAELQGGRPGSCPSDSICGCSGRNVKQQNPPLVFDIVNDPAETTPLNVDEYPVESFIELVAKAVQEHQSTIPWSEIPNQLESMARASLFPCCNKGGIDPWPALLHLSSTSCRCDDDVPR